MANGDGDVEIKLFRYVQKYYRTVGIHPPSKDHQYPPINGRNPFGLMLLICMIAATFGYFVFKASTIEEYGMSFFSSFYMVNILVLFIVNSLKIRSILNLIQKFEDFIEMSEYYLDFLKQQILLK